MSAEKPDPEVLERQEAAPVREGAQVGALPLPVVDGESGQEYVATPRPVDEVPPVVAKKEGAGDDAPPARAPPRVVDIAHVQSLFAQWQEDPHDEGLQSCLKLLSKLMLESMSSERIVISMLSKDHEKIREKVAEAKKALAQLEQEQRVIEHTCKLRDERLHMLETMFSDLTMDTFFRQIEQTKKMLEQKMKQAEEEVLAKPAWMVEEEEMERKAAQAQPQTPAKKARTPEPESPPERKKEADGDDQTSNNNNNRRRRLFSPEPEDADDRPEEEEDEDEDELPPLEEVQADVAGFVATPDNAHE